MADKLQHRSSKILFLLCIVFTFIFMFGMGYLILDENNASNSDIKHDSNAIMFIGTIISFLVTTFIILFKILLQSYNHDIISNVVVYILMIVFISIALIFFVINYLNPDEEIDRAIRVILKYYQDILIICIMKFVLLGIYSIIRSRGKGHESYLLFVSIVVMGISSLLILLFKNEFKLWKFWNFDGDRIEDDLLDKIRTVDGIEKNYKCISKDGTPQSNKPITCVDSKPVMNNENTLNETLRHYSTLFWVKFFYYSIIGIIIIGIFISMIEYVHSYNKKVTCINEDEIIGEPIETNTGTQITYKKKSKEPPAPPPKTE